MGLEAVTTVHDLSITNPVATDLRSEGDDHIRNIKKAILNAFPGLSGRVFRPQTKIANYTVALTDDLSFFNIATTGITLAMTAAATLGAGFTCFVHANGYDVTIDPNSSETVNGALTQRVDNGNLAIVFCNGTSFVVAQFPLSTYGFSTGDVKATLKTVADTGWIMANNGTIGDTLSGGTTRANDDTAALFALVWANTSVADCTILTSAGAGSTKGANAAADFAAHKQISIPKALGRALASAGSGSGLTARALGSIAGAETVTLDTTMMPAHAHGVNDPTHSHGYNEPGTIQPDGLHAAGVSTVESIGAGTTDAAATGITIASSGGGLAHPNMQPTWFMNFMIKL